MSSSTIDHFDRQKQEALAILSRLSDFLNQGDALGVGISPELAAKVRQAIGDVRDEKLRIALVGGFSEGKTSIAAAWMERLDRATMQISHQESSNAVRVYAIDDKLELVDTPGLFGFKEQVNPNTHAIQKYKDITKTYVSEAHLVLYVMNSTNPIKESHAEDLQWLFRELGLLPRTVFVLSRFDEVADVADEEDFREKLEVKRHSIAQRLDQVLRLELHEKAALSIVAVAANPFDRGVEHWLARPEEFRRLSHVGQLQEVTRTLVERGGGAVALANEVKKSIISDVIHRQLPVAREGFERLRQESEALGDMRREQEGELDNVAGRIESARLRLRRRIIDYFQELLIQAAGVGLETFNDFFQRQIGDSGLLIDQRVREIFADEISGIAQDLSRIQLQVDAEIEHLESVGMGLGKQGLGYLSKGNFINRDNVLLVRDGIQAVAKWVGLDLGGLLKFKPWGATNLAKGLNGTLAFLGVGLEIWDSWKEYERKTRFEEAMRKMQGDLRGQRDEIVALIDNPGFPQTFFPAFAQIREQLQALQAELERVAGQCARFREWYAAGEAIDVEFRELRGEPGPITVSAPEAPAPIRTRPNVEERAPEVPPAKAGGLWNRLFG